MEILEIVNRVQRFSVPLVIFLFFSIDLVLEGIENVLIKTVELVDELFPERCEIGFVEFEEVEIIGDEIEAQEFGSSDDDALFATALIWRDVAHVVLLRVFLGEMCLPRRG